MGKWDSGTRDDAVLPLELAPLPANDDDDDCCALGSGGAFCAI